MTERIKGVTVTFRQDLREDDAQPIIDAIAMLRGVVHVEPHINTSEDHITRMQVRNELRAKLFKALEE